MTRFPRLRPCWTCSHSPPGALTSTDFDSDPIATRSPFAFPRSDFEVFVLIDVTSLMVEAQRLEQSSLQLRFLLDFTETLGLVEIYDGDDFERRPLLTVEYQ